MSPNGGGLVIVHAANNAFEKWPEWNKMIGLGWRDNKFGDRISLNDKGETVRTPAGEGPGAGHGPQHPYKVIVRDPDHPVTKGMPAEWMHATDELYHGQRGPAARMQILATAYSDEGQGGDRGPRADGLGDPVRQGARLHHPPRPRQRARRPGHPVRRVSDRRRPGGGVGRDGEGDDPRPEGLPDGGQGQSFDALTNWTASTMTCPFVPSFWTSTDAGPSNS